MTFVKGKLITAGKIYQSFTKRKKMAFICRNVTYAIFLFFAKYQLVELMLKSNTYSENVFEIHGATDS